MQKILSFLAAMLFCCCSADNEVIAQTTMDKIYITIGGQTQSVTLVDNDATRELVAALQDAPITVTLNDNNQRQQFRDMGLFRQNADNEKRADDSSAWRCRSL